MKPISRGVIYWTFSQSMIQLLSLPFRQLIDKGEVEKFEDEFARHFGCQDVVIFPHARVAIWAILKKLNLPAGSKIIMPPITIKPILEVVLSMGLEPVFCDLDQETACFDIIQFELALKHGASVALITPLFGLSFNSPKMLEICARYNCISIVDFSQALTTTYNGELVWKEADFAVYSASAIKTLDTLGGGILKAKSRTDLEELKIMRDALPPASFLKTFRFARRNLLLNALTSISSLKRVALLAVKLMSHRNSSRVIRQTGTRATGIDPRLSSYWLSKYSAYQARLGSFKLDQIHQLEARRRDVAIDLRSSIGNFTESITFPASDDLNGSTFWQHLVYVDDPNALQRHLWTYSIDSGSTSLSYLPSLLQEPENLKYFPRGKSETQLPTAEKVYYKSLFIPCYPGLNKSDQSRLRDAILSFQTFS